jgi:Transglutaminase-like superfamily
MPIPFIAYALGVAAVALFTGCDAEVEEEVARQGDTCDPFQNNRTPDMSSPSSFTDLSAETSVSEDSKLWEMIGHVREERGLAALGDINQLVHDLPHLDDVNDNIRMTRGLDQLLDVGVYGSCHDYAIAFAGLARASGFPTIFIESVDKSFINGESYYAGHAFLKVFVEDHLDGVGRWILVDPTQGIYYNRSTSPGECLPGKENVEYADGSTIRICDRINAYEVESLWGEVGFGMDPIFQCYRIFQSDFESEHDPEEIIFHPHKL